MGHYITILTELSIITWFSQTLQVTGSGWHSRNPKEHGGGISGMKHKAEPDWPAVHVCVYQKLTCVQPEEISERQP